MEKLLKAEYSLRTTGFEPVPSDSEHQVKATRIGQAPGKCSNAGDYSQFAMEYS